MSKIFISYNRKSVFMVQCLANDIAALGHEPWYDQDLSGGQAWWEEILKHILDCDIFIYAISPESLHSQACNRERDYANDLGKPILPIQVTIGMSSNLLPPILSKIQKIDYFQQDRKAVIGLAKAIAAIPHPHPMPHPLPTPPDVPISYLGELAVRIETALPLDFEKQSRLLVELKASFREEETSSDALVLLNRFRKRHDLFANIAVEIDELLAISSRALLASQTPAKPNSLRASSKPVVMTKAKNYFFKLEALLFNFDREKSVF